MLLWRVGVMNVTFQHLLVLRAHTAFSTSLCLFCEQTQVLWTSRQGMIASGEKPFLDTLASDINQDTRDGCPEHPPWRTWQEPAGMLREMRGRTSNGVEGQFSPGGCGIWEVASAIGCECKIAIAG